MSQSPPNYMDGVPVKISERFKPPPKITLPQSVINRLTQVDSGRILQSMTVNYDFELESTVLKRLSEWRVAKEKDRYEREERVRVKELERTRLAEEEQKQRRPGDSNESDVKTKENYETSNFKNTEVDTSVEQKETAAPQQSLGYQVQSQYPLAAYPQNSEQVDQANEYYKSFNSYHFNYGQYVPTTTAANASFMPVDSRFFGQCTSSAGTSYQQPVQSSYHQSYSQGQAGTYNYFPYTGSSNGPATLSTYANAYFYNSAYGHQSQATPNYNYPGHTNTTASTETPSAVYIQGVSGGETSTSEASSLRSKSKSVPDIVRQLDAEVKDSALRRTRNNSQSVAEDKQPDENKCVEKPESVKNFTLYNQLSLTDQNLVKRIGSMGFPLERVAAVLLRIGNDDKKIVEHLIPLSELLDLGFEEKKISEALVKFDNNKHKALDYLIL
ncbi:uncharacterized protein LOC134219084 isoform X2 [Armigeres subalbatus]|uniref:uncharacterized protein LOC134219084 isoform X2 n=1 Tax=Armigeres subalbatus TaxID=124917 RepID=UPI002ED5591C